MISTLKKLQDKKAAQEINGGFTLIELLIVIVVLGILAAVVVFSLGSVTSKSALSACQADGATVNTAMAAYNANNGSYPTTTDELIKTSSSPGGPYLQSWPSNPTHYQFQLTSKGVLQVALPTATGKTTNWVTWAGASSCSLGDTSVTPAIPATVK